MSNGIDCLEFVYNDSYDEQSFKMLKDKKVSKFCWFEGQQCYELLESDFAIRVKYFYDGVKVITNPNHYPSFEFMFDYLEHKLGLPIEFTKITRLDLNCDLDGPLKYWKNFINVKHKQNYKQFYVGKYDLSYVQNNLTGIHVGGTSSEERLCIYERDDIEKTRIEIKLTDRKIPVKKTTDLPLIVRRDFKPFQYIEVRNWEILNSTLTTEKRINQAKDFTFLTEQTCLIQSLRQLQHKARLPNCCFDYTERIDLNAIWKDNAVSFFD